MYKLRTFLLSLVFGGLHVWAPAAFAHELKKTDEDIDPKWNEIVPTARHIYESFYTADKTDHLTGVRGVTYEYGSDEITAGVLSDYAKIINLVLDRPMRKWGHQKQNYHTQLVNAYDYDRDERLPENLNIYGATSDCDTECEKLIFEGHVKSVTMIIDQTAGNKVISGLSNEIGEPNLSAIRYYKSDCGPRKTTSGPVRYKPIRKKEIRKYQNSRDIHAALYPDFGLCLGSESLKVSRGIGFYSNQSSALMPHDLYEGLSQLEHVSGGAVINPVHWSSITPKYAKPKLVFEAACIKMEPALPDPIVQILRREVNETRRPNRKSAYLIQLKMEKGRLCYRPHLYIKSAETPHLFFPAMISNPASNFFKHLRPNPPLDYRRILGTEYVIDEIKSVELTTDADIISFLRTLDFLIRNHPHYYEHIFPEILPHLIVKLPSKYLLEHFEMSPPPIGSLSNYYNFVETEMDNWLESAGCEDWHCEGIKFRSDEQLYYHHLILGLGKKSLPILERMDAAKTLPTKGLYKCIGVLPEDKKEQLYKEYKDERKIVAGILDFRTVSERTDPVNLNKAKVDKSNLVYNFLKNIKDITSGESVAAVGLEQHGYSINANQILFWKTINPEILTFIKDQGLMDDMTSITRHRYTKAEALLDTEYREEVLIYLETQLRNLERKTVTEQDKLNILGVDGKGFDKFQSSDDFSSFNDFGTIAIQRHLEILKLKEVLFKAKSVQRECDIHKRDPFSDAPFD